MKRNIIVLVILIAMGVAGWFLWQTRDSAPVVAQYQLAKVARRDMVQSVSATGTLSAVTTVEVGSEISGQVQALMADYNAPVTKGQIVARIDPLSYEALVRQAEAELALARANLLTQTAAIQKYQADLGSATAQLAAARAQAVKARAVLDNSQRSFERKKSLVDKAFIARNEFDAAETALAEAQAVWQQAQAQEDAARSKVASARAALAMAHAQIKEAEARIDLRQAALDKRRIDLAHTIIRSPVDGVVIDRSVDVGQTVAASLQAPKLFTIAQDLRKMEVSTAVDEADIGRIREGQPATFTVDAFGSRKFSGQVTQVRKQGETVQNVVTYTVIISAENGDLSLMPNMTANVEIAVHQQRHALAVPNSALRFKPADASLISSASFASAADGSSPEAAGRQAIRERFMKLAEALEMDAQQRQQMKQAFAKLRDRAREERQLGGGLPMRRGGQRDRFRRETNTIFKRILTPAQWIRYEQIIAGRSDRPSAPGTLWTLDENKRPLPVEVRVGVNDGSFAAVRGSGVTEDMPVIIGVQTD